MSGQSSLVVVALVGSVLVPAVGSARFSPAATLMRIERACRIVRRTLNQARLQ